jgi:hypothetical protein
MSAARLADFILSYSDQILLIIAIRKAMAVPLLNLWVAITHIKPEKQFKQL